MTQQCVTYIVGPNAPTIDEKINTRLKSGWFVRFMIATQNVIVVLYEKIRV